MSTPRVVLAGMALALSLVAGIAVHAAVQHVVLLKFKDDAPPAAVEGVLDGFEALAEQIPGIRGFQWGTDNSPEGLQQGFTHAFMVTFDDAAARDAYLPHPAHEAFRRVLGPVVEKAFAFDIDVEKPPRIASPGRVHHLVFFKFKDEASGEQIQKVLDAFAALPRKIPGLLSYQAGTNTFPDREISGGFTHGFLLTFTHHEARDDYLPHPAHGEFGGIVGPVLDAVQVVDFTVRPSGRTLLVTSGLEPYRVYQRSGDGDGAADLEFSGLAAGEGPIEARLLLGRRVVAGFDWREVGRARGGVFSSKLEGVPTGGEYTVEIRRRDALGNVAEITDVANILVGDLWILAGQSNMEGVGVLKDLAEPHPLVHSFTMAHRWELAVDPLHWLIDSRDPVHYGGRLRDLDEAGRRRSRAEWRKTRKKGAGLGLPFAREMVRHTGVPVGLIPAAHGGTSMEQWDSAKKDRGGQSLYGSMLKQVRRAGGRVKGALWYQGESDANAGASPQFAGRFRDLVNAFRKDLSSPGMPFYYVQIGRFVIDRDSPEWKVIQETQRVLPRELEGTAVVSVIDLALDDLIHVGTSGLKRVGRRLSKIARRELFGESQLKIGPRLQRARLSGDGRVIRVQFSEVNGRLSPAEKVAGFSLRQEDGKVLPLIYNASVDAQSPDTVILRLRDRLEEGARLWYGAGLDPHCNLVDAEDMAVLAFGPISVER